MRKDSVTIHKDNLEVLDKLSDKDAGQLFKAIKSYLNGEEVKANNLVKVTFTPFENQFYRDDQKYRKVIERNRANGSKGGRPKESSKNPKEPKKPSGFSGNPVGSQKNSKKPVSKNPLLPPLNGKSKGKISFLNETEFEVIGGNFEEVWVDYLRFRKELGKKYKSGKSERQGLKKLCKLSNEDPGKAQKIVSQSRANGWQGLFPIKENSKKSRLKRISEL